MPAATLRRIRRKFSPLRRATRIPVWADVAGRLGMALFLVSIAVAIHWYDRAGLRDQTEPSGHVSFLDVVYFTMISITTTGFGDIVPVSDRSRLIEAVIITPIRILVLFIFVGTAYNFLIKRSWEKWRMAHIQRQLSGHIVALGFGTSNTEAVRELIARGTPAQQIVVIDASESRLAVAEALGCNVLEGDATRDQILTDVHVTRASQVLVSAGRDDASILMVLTVRHLAPHVPISVVVRAADNELLARQAGATNVINPVSFTGLLLAGSCHGPHLTDYIADLASVAGRVTLTERVATPDDIGKPLRAIPTGVGVRLYRAGRAIGFWEPEAQAIEAGDLLLEIVPGNGDPEGGLSVI